MGNRNHILMKYRAAKTEMAATIQNRRLDFIVLQAELPISVVSGSIERSGLCDAIYNEPVAAPMVAASMHPLTSSLVVSGKHVVFK